LFSDVYSGRARAEPSGKRAVLTDCRERDWELVHALSRERKRWAASCIQWKECCCICDLRSCIQREEYCCDLFLKYSELTV